MTITRRSFLAAAASVPAVCALPITEASAAEAGAFDADVLVVGGGFSGLSAAVSALRKGAKVMLIDKRGVVGGDGVLSSGVVQSCHSVLHDRQGLTKGIEFEDYWKRYMGGLENEPLGKVRDNSRNSPVYSGIDKHNPEVQKRVVSIGPRVIDFMLEQGVEFNPINPAKPFLVAMKRGGLGTFAGNMKKELESKGAEVRMKTKALSLIVENDRVAGVNAEGPDGKKYQIRAKATVLATGGFLDNDYLMKRYKRFWSTLPRGVSAYGEERALDRTGDGIMMGKAIGAALESMETMAQISSRYEKGKVFISWMATYDEPAIIVNRHGKRVVNEFVGGYAGACLGLARQGETYGHMIVGSDSFNGPNRSRFRFEEGLQKGSLFEADTPEKLAEAVGIDPKGLRETFDTMERDAAAGKDSEFGRTDPLFRPLKAPYYITARGYACAYKTEGGLEVNTDFQVIRATDESPILGLYASGSTCGSISTKNSDVVASGIIAGENAAAAAAAM